MLKKTLESPLDCKEFKPVNPKGNQPWVPIGRTIAKSEAPVLCHLMGRTDSLEKTLILGKTEGKEEGTAEGEMIRKYHWLSGHEFEQTLGDSEGQGSLTCCSLWGCRVVSDLMTEQKQMHVCMYFGCAGSSLLYAGLFYFQCLDISFQWLLLLQSTGSRADGLQ